MSRLIVPLTGLLALACSQRLGVHECDALLDHYTERLLHEERPRMSFGEVKKKQEEARRLVRETPRFEFDRCAEIVTRDAFDCAMGAGNVDAIERCLL
jgi:hypothetical protein